MGAPEGPATQIVLVRHGETEWALSARHTGRTDVALTENGRRQALALGRCMESWDFALVLTSPLRRAEETCRLAGMGAAAEVRDDLREWDYGDYEGLTTAAIREQRPGWSLWDDGAPSGEHGGEVADRADRIVAELRAASGNAAVFGHGHMLRVLTARWVGLDARFGRAFALGTATVSVLGYERETPVLLRWNTPCG